MDSMVLVLIIILVSSLCSFSISSMTTGGLVYFLDKQDKESSLLETILTTKVKPPEFLQNYLQTSGTVDCQKISNKYNVYPPKATIYIPPGDDLNSWNLAGCNVYPNQSISFSNIYSRFSDSPSNFAPYVGKNYELSNLVNAYEKLTLNVEPGPRFCVYKNGSLDTCTQGSSASGDFKLKITQNGNLCLVDGNIKSWCALRDIDNGSLCTSGNCSGKITPSDLSNANLLTIEQFQNSHRTARLWNDKLCLYPDASPTSTPLWCNK